MEALDKDYYKIKDVAELIGVPQSTLRYWEKEFPECSPRRSATNIRYYTPADIETLRIIHFLLKVRGLKLDAAKEQLRVNRHNVSRRMEVIDRLGQVREELVNLRKALNIRK
ncbi:MAG TPA: transcriptional regulator [Porphyromonadaceae bacterium]|nr:transcriptional regulator [Porphyromonadaceae bacterium]